MCLSRLCTPSPLSPPPPTTCSRLHHTHDVWCQFPLRRLVRMRGVSILLPVLIWPDGRRTATPDRKRASRRRPGSSCEISRGLRSLVCILVSSRGSCHIFRARAGTLVHEMDASNPIWLTDGINSIVQILAAVCRHRNTNGGR